MGLAELGTIEEDAIFDEEEEEPEEPETERPEDFLDAIEYLKRKQEEKVPDRRLLNSICEYY